MYRFAHANITGIVLEIHFVDKASTEKAINLLSRLRKNFLLVHVHGNNCCSTFTTENSIGNITNVLELSYINRSLVDSYHISETQTHPISIDMPNCADATDAEFEVLY